MRMNELQLRSKILINLRDMSLSGTEKCMVSDSIYIKCKNKVKLYFGASHKENGYGGSAND